MAEEQSTHVVYKGKHYVLPGVMDSSEALLRVQNLTGGGPKLQRLQAGTPAPEGFESTEAEAADILQRRREPNLPRDVIPKLAEFALLGSLGGAGGAVGRGVAGLRGLSTATKAARVARAGAKAAGYTTAGLGAKAVLDEAGVPPVVTDLALAAAGLGSKPGRAAVSASLKALAGETAAAREVPIAARAVKSAVSVTTPSVRVPSVTSITDPRIAAARAAREAQAAQTVARARGAPAAVAAPAEETELAQQLRASLSTTQKPAPKAVSQAEEIGNKILEWKTKNKWSGGQMESALRNVYGIPPPAGRQMIRMVLEAAGVM